MISALKQSGRVFLPQIKKTITLDYLLSFKEGDNKDFCYMDKDGSMSEPIDLSKVKNLLIGPEGGWTDEEKESFRIAGLKCLSIGYSTMRAQIAAAVGSAIIVDSQMKLMLS